MYEEIIPAHVSSEEAVRIFGERFLRAGRDRTTFAIRAHVVLSRTSVYGNRWVLTNSNGL